MESHLQILQDTCGYPAYLEYKSSCIDKPFIRTGKPALYHQLFFPSDKLDEWTNQYVGFDYNGRSYSDVKIAESDGKIIKTSKGYTFCKNKMSELHTCVREWEGRFETRKFIDSPKV